MSKLFAFVKKKKVLFIVLAAIIVAIIIAVNVFGSSTGVGMGMTSMPSFTQLTKQDVETVIVATGSTSSSTRRTVVGVAPAGTEIVELNISVGDTVKVDDVLASLDEEATQDKISDAKESYSDKSSSIFYSDQITDFDLSVTQNSVNDAQADYDANISRRNQLSNEITYYQNRLASIPSERITILTKWSTVTLITPADFTTLENTYNSLSPTIQQNPVTPEDIETVNAYNTMLQLDNQEATANATIPVLNNELTALASAEEGLKKALETAQNNLIRQSLQAQSTDNTNAQALDDLHDSIGDAIEDLDDLQIRSPLNGVVTEINYVEGDLFGASALCTIQDLNSLEIIATVPSYDVVKLENGMQAKFTTDSTGTTEMRGTITAISPIATDTSGGFSVTISVDDQNKDLRAGVPSQVTFLLEAAENAYAVPIDAIVEMNGSSFIYIYDNIPTEEQLAMGEQDGRRMIQVQTGLESDYLVEITSPELFEGMIVLDDPMGMNVATMMGGDMTGGLVIGGAPPTGGGSGGGGGNRPGG